MDRKLAGNPKSRAKPSEIAPVVALSLPLRFDMSTPYIRPETSRRESNYLTFTPRRSAIASFDNLVVLANYEEHLREARKIVWRDRGEPAVDIRDIRECLVHGARGGLRTF
jgi:hypothetical protein